MRTLRAATTRQKQRVATERDILKAAEKLLATHHFSELTTDAIMTEAGLSRTAFYRYFPDIASLVLRLYDEVSDEVADALSVWTEKDLAPREAIERAFRQLADVYSRHGVVLKAVSRAAEIDPEIEAVYSTSSNAFIAAIRARLKADRDITVLSEDEEAETAAALMWMIERYLSREIVGANAARVDKAIATLTALCTRAIYGCNE